MFWGPSPVGLTTWDFTNLTGFDPLVDPSDKSYPIYSRRTFVRLSFVLESECSFQICLVLRLPL
jgi:hypothetical protein